MEEQFKRYQKMVVDTTEAEEGVDERKKEVDEGLEESDTKITKLTKMHNPIYCSPFI